MTNSEDEQTLKQIQALNINITSIFNIPNKENLDVKRTNKFVIKSEKLCDIEKNNSEKITEIWDIWKSFSFEDFKK